MSIWIYQDNVNEHDTVQTALQCVVCPFCRDTLRVLKNVSEGRLVHEGEHSEEGLHVRTCDVCGWWWAKKTDARLMTNVGKHRIINPTQYHEYSVWGAVAVLKKLDPTDIAAPVSEVRDHLARKFESRFELHPRVFEETVASVFGDLGYRATATAYSGDDGIDVVLEGAGRETIGVQVKRYKNRIGVAQIREFAGSLMLNGIPEGIFVTVSDFQSGAQGTVDRLEKLRGMSIKLVNGKRFYETLQLSQRNRYQSLQEADAPFQSATFTLVKRDEYKEDPFQVG
jgi:restriction system protein